MASARGVGCRLVVNVTTSGKKVKWRSASGLGKQTSKETLPKGMGSQARLANATNSRRRVTTNTPAPSVGYTP
ncbi:MAG: hypothetical protein M1540_04275 [Candidatus Bathyarchaeota archaeon]|nr:hypothetical protein [Candidatus Bathyarchaeota archaeon]